MQDLALGVQRDDRQRHADRLGQILEARAAATRSVRLS